MVPCLGHVYMGLSAVKCQFRRCANPLEIYQGPERAAYVIISDKRKRTPEESLCGGWGVNVPCSLDFPTFSSLFAAPAIGHIYGHLFGDGYRLALVAQLRLEQWDSLHVQFPPFPQDLHNELAGEMRIFPSAQSRPQRAKPAKEPMSQRANKSRQWGS